MVCTRNLCTLDMRLVSQEESASVDCCNPRAWLQSSLCSSQETCVQLLLGLISCPTEKEKYMPFLRELWLRGHTHGLSRV